MFKMFVNWIDAYVWGIHRSVEDKKIAFNLSCYQPLSWCFSVEEYQIVHTPPFPESITEGDVRWEKGEVLWKNCFLCFVVLSDCSLYSTWE